MKKYRKELFCLGIEMTRRCNMACDFCSKGAPQNLDISKEIIDKILDEFQDVFIFILRVTGGEPMLTPEMIIYLIDQIITKRILINEFVLFSNGSVRDERLITAFKKMTNYLHSIEKETSEYAHYGNYWYKAAYHGTEEAKVSIVISTHHHDNQNLVDETIDFYNQVNEPGFAVVSQSDTFPDDDGRIILEGNAAQNFRSLLSEPVDPSKVRRLVNKFHFVSRYNNDPGSFVATKTLSVSSNGNVHPGCMMPYENIDIAPMFNILDCNHDFAEKVQVWCWDHPISEHTCKFLEKYAAIKFCLDHGLSVDGVTEDNFKQMTKIKDCIMNFENLCKTFHREFPKIEYEIVKLLSASIGAFLMLHGGMSKTSVESFLHLLLGGKKAGCEKMDDKIIKDMTDLQYLYGQIKFLLRKEIDLKHITLMQAQDLLGVINNEVTNDTRR